MKNEACSRQHEGHPAVAVMQPYLFPYIGYWQLISAVDVFVVYDNIKYTKKGWINRNRMLVNGSDAVFSVPLARGSDFLHIRDRELAGDHDPRKLLGRFEAAYARAPQFAATFPLVERVLRQPERNLFGFLHGSIVETCRHLGLAARILVSSEVAGADHGLRGSERVLSLCRALGARRYVNAIGGTALYAKEDFAASGVSLQFVRSRPFEYPQFGGDFVPWLSIVDVLMFNPLAQVQECIAAGYDLV